MFVNPMMDASLRRATAADRRGQRAAILLQEGLDRHRVPELRADAPRRFAEDLARLYGVRRWSKDELVRAWATGALSAWQPGSRVVQARGEIRVVSPVCPMAAEAELDPQACRACQAFQRDVARIAGAGDITDFHAEETITHGDATCTAVYTKRTEQE